MKTELEKIKDDVAWERGYPNWEEYYNWIARDGEFPSVVAQLIEGAMEDVAKLYADSKVKKLNIPAVMVELPCDEEIEQQARKVNEGDIDYGYVFGAKWMRGLAKGN